jgi:hypothetical protein
MRRSCYFLSSCGSLKAAVALFEQLWGLYQTIRMVALIEQMWLFTGSCGFFWAAVTLYKQLWLFLSRCGSS